MLEAQKLLPPLEGVAELQMPSWSRSERVQDLDGGGLVLLLRGAGAGRSRLWARGQAISKMCMVPCGGACGPTGVSGEREMGSSDPVFMN